MDAITAPVAGSDLDYAKVLLEEKGAPVTLATASLELVSAKSAKNAQHIVVVKLPRNGEAKIDPAISSPIISVDQKTGVVTLAQPDTVAVDENFAYLAYVIEKKALLGWVRRDTTILKMGRSSFEQLCAPALSH